MKSYQHVLFWTLSTFLLVIIFGNSFGSMLEALFFVSMLLPVIIGTSYFFNYQLVPKFLETKNTLSFGLHIIYMLIISVYLEMLVITISFMYLANYQYSKLSSLSSDVIILAITMYLFVLLFSFILLVNRSFKNEKNISQLEEEQKKQKIGYLNIRADRKNVKIKFEEISFVESLGDYVKIHTKDKSIVITRERISAISEKLPDNFVRVHRSFIVNRNHITSFNKEIIFINDNELPISRSYKTDALALLKS